MYKRKKILNHIQSVLYPQGKTSKVDLESTQGKMTQLELGFQKTEIIPRSFYRSRAKISKYVHIYKDQRLNHKFRN